jgi:hypothetical protein
VKVLFITTTNLATNPRLVKEIDLATSMGFEIELIQFNLNNWSDKLTKQILSKFPRINNIEIEAGRRPFVTWFISSVIEKIVSYLPSLMLNTKWLSISLNKRAYLIQRHYKFVSSKPDIIIAHNPGSFYPAMFFADKLNTEFAIDIEDYHPGETLSTWQSNRMKKLIFKTLPKAKYASFASKLIKEQMEGDFRIVNISLNNPILIDNVFPKSEFTEIKPFPLDQSKLNFVWFSQNIDYNRGLESIFSVFDECPNEISLTLIGNIRNEFYQNEIEHRSYIHIEEPKTQKELHSILPNFDIGLALEPGRDLNNSIAVSNKIWAYLQSGVYILATSTSAQSDFISKFPSNGELIFENGEEVMLQMTNLIQKKLRIRATKNERRKLNHTVNWEQESSKLQFLWKFHLT